MSASHRNFKIKYWIYREKIEEGISILKPTLDTAKNIALLAQYGPFADKIALGISLLGKTNPRLDTPENIFSLTQHPESAADIANKIILSNKALISEDVAQGLFSLSDEKNTGNEHTKKTKICDISHGYNIIKFDVLSPKKGLNAGLENLVPEVAQSILFSFLNNKELGRLSTCCVTLYNQNRERSAFLRLLQAIVFNDPSIIASILDSYPDFLLAKAEAYGVRKIKCQTGRQYNTEDESALSMAQKLRHLNVLEAILPYYLNKLKEAEIHEDKVCITELENMWTLQIPTIQEQEELQKKYYQELIFPMINALKEDDTIRVEWMQNSDTKLYEAIIDNANEATLNARNALRNELFRPKAMKECIDVIQFFIAAIKAYSVNFNMNTHIHPHGAQRDAYRVWVIGLAQSLVGLDLAMLLHNDMDSMVVNHGAIGASFYNWHTHIITDSLKLSDLRSFYRRACDHGLGSSFLYSIYPDCSPNSFGQAMEFADLSEPVSRAYMLFQAKAAKCVELTQRVQQRQDAEETVRFVIPESSTKSF